MRVTEPLRNRLRNNRWLFSGVSLALLVFTAAYYLVLRSRDLDATLINNQILLFTLRNVNVVLVLAVLFVLLRNLFKLWVERQNRILGSRFKTKLVATYIGLTLIPVLLLFAYANELMQGSIDRLFRSPSDALLGPGHDVAQALTSTLQDLARRDAQRALEAIAAIDLSRVERRPQLDRVLQRELRRLDTDVLAVYEDTEFIHAAIKPQAAIGGGLPRLDRSFLHGAVRDGSSTKIEQLGPQRGRLILAAVARAAGNGPSAVLVAGRLLPAHLAEQSSLLVEAFQARRQLEVQKPDIKAVYLLLFLMITLVILLTSSWMGLYLARRVTVPIQALAEGTRRIMTGDLEHRVEAAADDELGVLVNSFNLMTTELQRNRQQLLESNRHLQAERARIGAVLENVSAGVLSVGAQGRIETCNGAALAMLRRDEAAVVGRSLDEVFGGPELAPILAALQPIGATPSDPAGSGQTQLEVRAALGGEWRTFQVTRTTMRDGAGEPSGHVVVLEDLSELIKAQQLATWTEAARRIAHEIKNPLTPIKLSVERILLKHRQRDPSLGRTIEESARIIGREVDSMKSMVDEFARFARMPQPRLQKTDLKPLLEEAASLYREIKPGVGITTETSGDVHDVAIDAEQVRGALINLLDNAVAATDPPGQIRLRAARDNGTLTLEVRDSGHGIPPAAKAKLFLPYYSTKGRGSGLGLAIVHRIVADHHGSIRVEDNHPRGTVFTIELPQ